MGPFNLTICLRVIYGGVIELNAQISAPVFHLIGCEIGAVIGDDAMWDTITVYNAGYKVYYWSGFGRFHWFGFYPFGELVNHDQ